MKPLRTLIALPLILAALSACSKSGSSPSYSAPEDEAASASAPAPSVDENLAREAGRERIVYHVGPIDLAAGTKAEAMLDRPLTMRFQTDKAVWVTGFVPKVVDANGAELPSELLHSAMVFNMHEENPLCAGSPNPFVVASAMMTGVDLPQGYGYPVLATDPIEAKVVLANPTDRDYVDVYFELTLVAKPVSDYAGVKDVKPMFVELEPCTHAAMSVEPGKFVQKSATYQMPVKSQLVVANGELQNYGAAIQLIAGKEISPFWRAEAIEDEKHRISALTDNPFAADKISFAAGDSLTFSVAYDNTSDSWLAGANSGAMLYLAPSD